MIISDKIYINTQELGLNVSALCEQFTYPNPEYYQAKMLKISTAKIPDKIFHYKLEVGPHGQRLVLPRGGHKKVIKFLADKKLPQRISSQEILQPEIDVFLKETVLEPQQDEMISVLKENTGGLVELSPGAGKSIGILGLISEVKQPTLILVNEHRLRSQWEKEIKLRLGGAFKFGRYDGDKHEDGDIVIGLIQTVHKMYDENPACLNKFGMLVVDEVHEVPSNTFMKVINNCAAKWRVGVTGTVDRKDGKHILIFDMFGPKLLEIGEADLKHRITSFEYEMIPTEVCLEVPTLMRWTGRSKERKLDPANALTLLLANVERNDVICNKIVDSINEGYYPLVLSDRVEHCELLHQRILAAGYKSVLMVGKTRKKADWLKIREDTTIKCIIAQSRIATKALDHPVLSAIHLTCPSTNLPNLKQKIGRIRRFLPGKILPRVYDYVDNRVYHIAQSGKAINNYKNSAAVRRRYYDVLQTDYDDD